MKKIWLADLTYTQQNISNDVVPAAVAMIAEYTEKLLKDKIKKIKIFKYPEELTEALKTEKPDFFCTSNYVWNSRLSDIFCKRVKEVFPETKIIVGGPNFPTNAKEQKEYLKKKNWIDFYIIKEAEHAFSKLIEFFITDDNNKDIKDVPNLAFISQKGELIQSSKFERIMDLSLIPSPYLSGRLDRYLDGRLLPVIQTNRGCPFSCTFCTEGQTFWSKVRKKDRMQITDEIKWITRKIKDKKNKVSRDDLLIADSNFGMFNEDIDTCNIIAEQQKDNGYPKYINVATGKNRKEKVLEAAKIVNGAIKLMGSVQSLDPNVQKNIKRSNISSDQIVDLALNANEIGANSWSEIILGLPGDSFESHSKTLKTLVDSAFNTISMYQLMMLPGTELNTQETRKKYEMKTMFRVLPRCFGYFNILGKDFSVAEIEEVCVSTSTLSYDDYLKARKLNFFVNVFYNEGVFEEILVLFYNIGISRSDWINFLFNNHEKFGFSELVDLFINETRNELSSKEDLEVFVSNKENIKKYISGEFGNNLMFKYKALSISIYAKKMCEMVRSLTRNFLRTQGIKNTDLENLIDEMIISTEYKITDLFTENKNFSGEFNYNLHRIKVVKEINDIKAIKFNSKRKVLFRDTGRKEISKYVEIFGSDSTGLTRILSRVYLKKLMRSPIYLN